MGQVIHIFYLCWLRKNNCKDDQSRCKKWNMQMGWSNLWNDKASSRCQKQTIWWEAVQTCGCHGRILFFLLASSLLHCFTLSTKMRKKIEFLDSLYLNSWLTFPTANLKKFKLVFLYYLSGLIFLFDAFNCFLIESDNTLRVLHGLVSWARQQLILLIMLKHQSLLLLLCLFKDAMREQYYMWGKYCYSWHFYLTTFNICLNAVF